ncbi:MAG: MFS transporter, partial [Oscillospiraceae bacterium]
LHLGYALGSVAAPPFAAKMVMSSVWNYSYSIMGGFMTFAGLVFLYIMVRYKKAPDTENNTQGNMQKKIPYFALMKNRKMIMLCLISFCQSGAMLFTIWLPTYLIQVNATKYPIEFSSMIITLYFVLSVVSRALLSSALKRVSVINYLKYGSLFSSIAVFTTIIADSRLIWIVGMVVLGIVCGANYTAQTVLICDQFPQYSSTSTSLCGISRAFGNIVLNAAIGMFLQKGLNRTSMMTIVISMMLVSVILWISYDMHGKIKKCDNAVEA